MGRYKYILLTILLFIFTPVVKANTCSNSEIAKYKELAKNIEINYDYEELNGTVNFKIKINNMVPGIKIKDVSRNSYYDYTGNEIVLDNLYVQGNSYVFKVYTTDSNCYESPLYSHYITLPYYNYYYNSPLCDGIEEYKYCQKWIKALNYDELKRYTDQYKNKKETQTSNKTKFKEERGIFDLIVDLYLKYYYIILPLIIIVSIIAIRYNKKKDDLF